MGSTVTKQGVLQELQDWKQKSATDNHYVTADKVKNLVSELKQLGIDPSGADLYTDVRTLFDDAPENLLSQVNNGNPTAQIDKQWSAALDDLLDQVNRAATGAPIVDAGSTTAGTPNTAPVVPTPTDGSSGPPTSPAVTPSTTSTAQASGPADAVPYNPSTNSPGFSSGTPVPGTGNGPVSATSLDAIPKDSDYRKALQAADPSAVDSPSSSGEHGQLGGKAKSDTTSSNSDLAAKAGYSAVTVNGGTEMAVFNQHGQMLLFDAKTGKDITSSLPFFAKASDPSGTVVFGDGTRLDLKATDGATFVSGGTVTTVQGGKVNVQQGNAATQTYLQNNARNPYNLAVAQGDGSFAETNGVDGQGRLQWVKADGSSHYIDGDGASANDPTLQAALNGTAPVAGVINKEQSYALNPGFSDYMVAMPANDGTPAGKQAALAQAAMAGWTEDNSGATSSRPITKAEHAERLAEGIILGVLTVLPVADFLGPMLGEALGLAGRGAAEGAGAAAEGGGVVAEGAGVAGTAAEVGEQALISMGRASRTAAPKGTAEGTAGVGETGGAEAAGAEAAGEAGGANAAGAGTDAAGEAGGAEGAGANASGEAGGTEASGAAEQTGAAGKGGGAGQVPKVKNASASNPTGALDAEVNDLKTFFRSDASDADKLASLEKMNPENIDKLGNAVTQQGYQKLRQQLLKDVTGTDDASKQSSILRRLMLKTHPDKVTGANAADTETLNALSRLLGGLKDGYVSFSAAG